VKIIFIYILKIYLNNKLYTKCIKQLYKKFFKFIFLYINYIFFIVIIEDLVIIIYVKIYNNIIIEELVLLYIFSYIIIIIYC